MLYDKIYVCATKNICALLTFTENCGPLAWLLHFNRMYFLQFHSLGALLPDARGHRFVINPSAHHR